MKILKFNDVKFITEAIENDKRLDDKIVAIINEQIKNELESSQIYRGMTCWLDDKGWISASKYFFKSAQEELVHQDKFYNYLFDKNCLAKVPVVGEVKQDFKDIREIIELSLEHEIEVTGKLEKISNLAKELDDNTTYQFMQWFLNEQLEEEEKWRDIFFRMNLDLPKYELEKLFDELLED
jgi:ferritin